MKNSEIKEKILNATKWATITEIAAKIISPITNMILARLLVPEAFGVVTSVVMIISFADMFTDAGFQKYLIQHEFKNDKEKDRSTNVAFWTNLVLSMFLWGVISLYCEPIASLVGNPGLGLVISISCIQLPLNSFSSVQMAMFRRDFDFKTLFWARISSTFIPFIVSIPLAFWGFSYWSIIIGTICGSINNAVILMIKSKWKPSWNYNYSILKEMFSFSLWSLIEAISIWLTFWIDALIIGSALNGYYIGIYKTSTTMVNTILSLVTASITPILFSALSRLQHDKTLFNATFFNMQRMVSIFVFPLGVGIFMYSDLATELLLGSQWSEASGVIGIWALTSAITIVYGHFCSEVYRAKGKPKISFLAQLLHLIILIPVCIISSKFGFWFLVYARAWIRMQAILVHFIIMKFFMGIPILGILRNVFPTALSAAFMGLLALFLKRSNQGMVWDISSILICTVFYFCALLVFPRMKNDFKNMYKIISRSQKKKQDLEVN